jgi:hypothetical protein
VIHADGAPERPGRGLAARLRDRDTPRSAATTAPYLRPMSHSKEARNRP